MGEKVVMKMDYAAVYIAAIAQIRKDLREYHEWLAQQVLETPNDSLSNNQE